MNYKVLISDNLSTDILSSFKNEGIDVVFRPDMGKDKLLLSKEIHKYDGLAIRSDTIISAELL